jgi:hypothetical protein
MFFQNYQNIVNVLPMTKLHSVKIKKKTKISRKKHKTKKILKKNPKGGKLKIKKTNPLYKKKNEKIEIFFLKFDFFFCFITF